MTEEIISGRFTITTVANAPMEDSELVITHSVAQAAGQSEPEGQRQSRSTMTNQIKLPIREVEKLQDILSIKFDEMIEVHKELMLQLLHKQKNRGAYFMSHIQTLATLLKQNQDLNMENERLRQAIRLRSN